MVREVKAVTKNEGATPTRGDATFPGLRDAGRYGTVLPRTALDIVDGVKGFEGFAFQEFQ